MFNTSPSTLYGTQLKQAESDNTTTITYEISSKVLDLDLDELQQARRLLNSEFMHHLAYINQVLKEGHKLSKAEQHMLDKFIDAYNIQYKSPLAEALKEDEGGNDK